MFSRNATAKGDLPNKNAMNQSDLKNKIPMTKRHLTSTPAARRKRDHEEWRASLRKACFDRARKNRRDVIWKKRQQQPHWQQPSQIGSEVEEENGGDLRSVVEQELRQQGVAIVTPGLCEKKSDCMFASSPTEIFHASPQTPKSPYCIATQLDGQSADSWLKDDYNDCFDDGTTENFISEEELHDLLQDIEDEVRRSEEELLEEVLEQERWQELEIQAEIAHYQEWEDQLPDELPDEECVICPICWESMLRQSPKNGDIICPSDACQFKFRQLAHPQQGLLLVELKERLRLALENHSVRCHGSLIFELQRTDNKVMGNLQDSCSLVGTCHTCGAVLSIA